MGDATDRDRSADGLYDETDVLEPDTTGNLAPTLAAPRAHVRDFFDRLAASGRVRTKAAEAERASRIRTPPTHDCGYAHQVRDLHPVLSTVRFRPQCGAQVQNT